MTFETPGRERHRRSSNGTGEALAVSPGNPTAVGADDYPATRCPGPAPFPPPGPLFAGRYEILRELGRGGMGVVLQARDTRLPRDVAIKVPLHLLEPDSLRRFFKEAEAAAKLDHPRICRILDLGEADGLPYIVLAFIQGRTLAEFVDGRRVEPARAAKITRSIARTIQFAHEQGIVHRDLKPSNLMIGPHRELVVMDFGLARLEGEERKTLTGQVFGTLPYMSPEQVQGRAGDMGKSCDIYTLGVIFYELLTGRLPFRGAAWELPRQIVQVEPEPPSSLAPDVDPALDAIVLKAMAKEIGDRFGSMREFAEAIAAHLQAVGSLSDSGLRGGPAPEPVKPAPASPGPTTGSRPRKAPFTVRLRHEPLREPGRGRRTAWDVLTWGPIAALALAGAHALLSTEGKPTRASAAGPVAEKPRKPGPASIRGDQPGSIDPRAGRVEDDGTTPTSSTRRPSPRRPGREGSGLQTFK